MASRAKRVAAPRPKKGKSLPDLPKPAAQKARLKAVAPAPVPSSPSKGRGRLGKGEPTSPRDPERLEDWWRKQKKSLRVPVSGPLVSRKKTLPPPTRTAKIDIKQRAIHLPSVSASLGEVNPSQTDSSAGGGKVPEPQSQAEAPASSPSVSGTMGAAGAPGSDTAGEGAEDPRSREGGEFSPEASSTLGSTGGGSVRASVGLGIKGSGGGTGGNSFFFPSYLQKIDSKIRWHWAPPPVGSGEDSLVVQFVINKNGAIDKNSVEVKESSGNIFFDQAALRAVFAAHPLPPLPEAYAEDRLIIYMNFVVKEDT